MAFEIDPVRWKALLDAKGKSQKEVALALKVHWTVPSQWLAQPLPGKQKRYPSEEQVEAISKLLGVPPEAFGCDFSLLKAMFEQREIYDFYAQLNETNVVCIVSADGYKERDDPDLFEQMLELLHRGVEVRYYYPKPGGRSLEDYQWLGPAFRRRETRAGRAIAVQGLQVRPTGRHLFGWRSRFVVIVRRPEGDEPARTEHAFEYFEAGMSKVGGFREEGRTDVWIRLEQKRAQAYLKELIDFTDRNRSRLTRMRSGAPDDGLAAGA